MATGQIGCLLRRVGWACASGHSLAKNARLNSFRTQLKKAEYGTERATNVVTVERIEQKINRCQRIINTIVEESN